MPAKVVGAGSEDTPESGGEGATKWCEIKKRRKKREEKSKRDEKKKVERKKEGTKKEERTKREKRK